MECEPYDCPDCAKPVWMDWVGCRCDDPELRTEHECNP